MPQDAFTLKYLCAELSELFIEGKVNRIIQPSNDEVVLTIYTGFSTKKLLLCVNPAMPRIGVISEEKDSPLTAPNFCMLLRKHLLSSTVKNIELVGFDRIVKIDFISSAEFSDSTLKTLYVELMGRYSNIILTENGKILGGNRGINMFDNGVRPLIVGRQYVFPPVGEKKLPNDKEIVEVFRSFDHQNFAEDICKNIQGIALSTAKEIQRKFIIKHGENTDNFSEKLYNFLNEFLYNTKSIPCVLKQNLEVKDVEVFPYETMDGERCFFDKLYLAEDYYFTEKKLTKDFSAKRERLNSVANTLLRKTKKKITLINARKKEAQDAEKNRIYGELIIANIYRFKGGEKECILDNYYDNTEVKITLDSRLSASKNAENYYKKYNKQKRTLLAIEPQLIQIEKEKAYFESLIDEIELCETLEDLSYIKQEMESEGLIYDKQKSGARKKSKESFCREYEYKGFRIKAGRNNAQNEKLTFTAMKEDIWVHAKDYHSSHVIIQTNGKKVEEEVIKVACEICAYYSKGREGDKVEIVYTARKNVKKPPKSKLGFCTYENFKSVIVKPQKHEQLLKEDKKG